MPLRRHPEVGESHRDLGHGNRALWGEACYRFEAGLEVVEGAAGAVGGCGPALFDGGGVDVALAWWYRHATGGARVPAAHLASMPASGEAERDQRPDNPDLGTGLTVPLPVLGSHSCDRRRPGGRTYAAKARR